ncbi:hypothetical protein L596_004216 [Steinernema carpocapsae]|uniref:CUB domain-containing protein n=1 Tax=Steinernema carpocapsae TaxID=34508 RepID=A0A4U8UV85_STECR|nr:hypothetical protein L596_004216 [Steinernema carpocapsae]
MITLDVELETEHCCDVLNVWGIDDDTSDFRGDERRQFAFAQQNTLNMTFSSDGLGTAVGFTVTVSSQGEFHCRCDNGRKIVMDPQKSTTVDIYSAGYGNELGYCPDMDCSWIVDFPEDYILTVTPVEVDLRYSYFVDENVVTVQDAFNRTLKSYRVQSDSASSFTPVTVSTGLANINFIGDSSGAFYGEKEKARGFHFQLSLRKMDLPSNSTVIHLSYDQRTEDIDLENLKANSMYIWTVNAPATAPIFFYTMRKISENLFVDLFDGPNEFAKPLDASMYYANATVSGPVPAVRTTGNFLTIRVFAKKSFPNFKAIVSIRNHNLLGCENNTFMYASSETSGQSASLNIVPPTENVTCYVLIASSMESRNNTYGIYMTHVEESAGVSVYKHVYTNSQFLLASSFPYPHIVYDDYVTIAYNSVSKPMKLDFRTQILSPKLSYNLRTDSAGLLFSSDYLEQSNSDPSKVSQQIVLDSRNSLFKVKIDVMRPVGNGTIFFAARNENQPLEGQIVNGSSLDTSITYNATNIKITYHSTGGTGGMFIKYSSVRIVEKSAISVFGGSLLYFISAFLMFYIFA